MAKKIKTNQQMQEWIDARRRRHLSHCQVQMAQELGLNPVKLGKIDNHKQEPWKLPLPQFIEQLYFERFGKTTPDNVVSIEERCRVERRKDKRDVPPGSSLRGTAPEARRATSAILRRCGPRC